MVMVAGVRRSLNSSQTITDFCQNTDDQINGSENDGKDRWPRGHLRELNHAEVCRHYPLEHPYTTQRYRIWDGGLQRVPLKAQESG